MMWSSPVTFLGLLPVLIFGKGGGLGMWLATPSRRKKILAKNANQIKKIKPFKLCCGSWKIFRKNYDSSWWKLRFFGRNEADSTPNNQSNNQYRHMECQNRENRLNNCESEEIQLESTWNQRNPSWTTKVRHGRDAAVLRSRREKCSTHSRSCSDAVQRSTKCTYTMGISEIQDHQSIFHNKGGNYNEFDPVLCTQQW